MRTRRTETPGTQRCSLKQIKLSTMESSSRFIAGNESYMSRTVKQAANRAIVARQAESEYVARRADPAGVSTSSFRCGIERDCLL